MKSVVAILHIGDTNRLSAKLLADDQRDRSDGALPNQFGRHDPFRPRGVSGRNSINSIRQIREVYQAFRAGPLGWELWRCPKDLPFRHSGGFLHTEGICVVEPLNRDGGAFDWNVRRVDNTNLEFAGRD